MAFEKARLFRLINFREPGTAMISTDVVVTGTYTAYLMYHVQRCTNENFKKLNFDHASLADSERKQQFQESFSACHGSDQSWFS